MSSGEWCTIESDPGVFTELLESIGVKHVELDELWSLDDASLQVLVDAGPVYGLIFLFKWKQGATASPASGSNNNIVLEHDAPDDLFFANQVTTNACATQALLSVVMNAKSLSDEDLGETLLEMRNFTSTLPPDLRGEVVGSSEVIKEAHNSFARRDVFLADGRTVVPTGDEDVFHFVAYVPFEGKVYELDGLQKGPILIGEYDASTSTDDTPNRSIHWMTVARTAIQSRMERLEGEIKFNLMAVMQDRRVGLNRQLESSSAVDDEQRHEVLAQLAAQDAKRHGWKVENQRRRHNYLPLCMQLLKELARSGNLPQLVTEANERVQAKRAKKSAAGES